MKWLIISLLMFFQKDFHRISNHTPIFAPVLIKTLQSSFEEYFETFLNKFFILISSYVDIRNFQ